MGYKERKYNYKPTFDTKADLDRTLNFASLAARIIEFAQEDIKKGRDVKNAEYFLNSEWCETLSSFVDKVTTAYEHDFSGKKTCLRGGL